MITELHHGSRAPLILAELRLSEPAQIKNGRLAEWAFATHRLDQATLYAAPFPPGGSFLDTFSAKQDREEGDTLTLFRVDSIAELRKPFHGRIYSFPVGAFEQVADFPREWVSDKPAPLAHARIRDVTSYEDVMGAGVQIFCLKPGMPRDVLDFKNPAYLFPAGVSRDAVTAVLQMTDSPLVWANREWGIGEDPALRMMVAGPSVFAPRHSTPTSGP